MKDLKAIRGHNLIMRLIEQGEHEHQDFKFAISDARKIARSVSAFANNDGGHLLVGVKDNGAVAGVRSEEDIFVIEQAAGMYCRPEVRIEVTAYNVGDRHIVFKVDIPRAKNRPVEVVEADNRLKAYYRVADENIVAHRLMVESWRLAAGADSPALSLSLDGPERSVIDVLEEGGEECLTPEQIAVRAHISCTTADSVITTLLALGIVSMKYLNGRWGVVLQS